MHIRSTQNPNNNHVYDAAFIKAAMSSVATKKAKKGSI